MATSAAQEKLAEVVRAGAVIARGLNLDETLLAVVKAAACVTCAAYSALGVLGPDRRISRLITTGLSDEQHERIANPPTGRGILGVLIDEAHPLRLNNLADDPRARGFPPHHPPLRSFLGAPVEGRWRRLRQPLLDRAPDDLTDRRHGPAKIGVDGREGRNTCWVS